ncbi:MAG: alcohol dehydrogenase catalytic domain-containing protein [Acidimicrobiales bacterium]
MRAAVLTEPGAPLAVVDLEDPTPTAGEVLLQVDACGICGSDLHAADVLPLPGLVMGHELCGTVVDVGPGVEGWAPGDRGGAVAGDLRDVRGLPHGRVRKCATAQMVGIERPGGYAELTTMPARDLHRLPDAVDARLGALVEPLAVALHTVQRAEIGIGDNALVLGGGPIGAAVALWLRQAGAHEVIVSDPVAHRRELSLAVVPRPSSTRWPRTWRVPQRPGAGRAAQARHRVRGPARAHPARRRRGARRRDRHRRRRVHGPDQVVPFTMMAKELDVRFAFYYTRPEFDAVIDLLARGRVDVEPLVTDEIGLDQLPDTFEALKRPSEQCKVLITP